MHKKFATLALCTSLLALSLSAEAQQPTKVSRVGYLSGTSLDAPTTVAFRQGLRDLGYVEGKNILVEYRFERNPDRVPSLVAELLQLKIDVLVIPTQAGIVAAKQATKTIPIVMITNADPVADRIIDTLGRPGGNITGLTRLTRELSGKRLELLRDVVLNISNIGVLWTGDTSALTLSKADCGPSHKEPTAFNVRRNRVHTGRWSYLLFSQRC